MVKALVTVQMSDAQKTRLKRFRDDVDLVYVTGGKQISEEIGDAEIIIGNPPAEVLSGAKALKWMQLITAGSDGYLQKGFLSKDVILTNASGAYGIAQAEFMLAMLFSLMKKLHRYRDNQMNAQWHDEGTELMLRGSTVLMLGLGDIGTEFTRLLKAFGCYVIGVRRDPERVHAFADEVHAVDDLDQLIPRADIIAMVLPASPETVNTLSRERISLMKQGAIVVNTGRGKTVDNEALCDAVEQGRIAGAALDVYDPEPIPPGHRIWKMREILITPHIAGSDLVPLTNARIFDVIEQNLSAYLHNQPLANIVDRTVYEFV